MKEQDKIQALNKSIETIKNKSKNNTVKNMIKIVEEEKKEKQLKKLSREYWKSYTNKK